MNTQILSVVFLGNSLLDYGIALGVLILSLLFVRIFVRLLVRHLKKWAEKTAITFDDFLIKILERIALPALYVNCFYLSFRTLTLAPIAEKVLNVLTLTLVTYFATRVVILAIGYAMSTYLSKKQKDPTLVRSLEGMFGAVKFLIWSLAVIILLDNLGYKVSTLLAGLGIGGVAVAIAAQTLLKDFFSYFSIVFDHPFKLGDFIIIGEHMGTVEHIGIKTTRIRSLSGELVVFSNTDLTDSRVRNYRHMEKRRVLFRLGVTYGTPLVLLKEIPKILEQAIKKAEGAEFDRAHFFSYGDFSLIFEIVYFVLSPDYNKYMDIQQQINFAIKEEFDKKGIEFAFPTQTLHVKKT